MYLWDSQGGVPCPNLTHGSISLSLPYTLTYFTLLHCNFCNSPQIILGTEQAWKEGTERRKKGKKKGRQTTLKFSTDYITVICLLGHVTDDELSKVKTITYSFLYSHSYGSQ